MSDSQDRISLSQWLDRHLADAGKRLQSTEGRSGIVRGCMGAVRKLVRWLVYAWVIALVLQCGLMRWVGEQNIFFAFCLYLPPSLWYLPALCLLPLCVLLWEWRGLLTGVAAGALCSWLFFGWKPNAASLQPAPHSDLVILTNNRGQNGNQSMKPFKNLVKPDVMVFQEAAGTAQRYLADPGYAEFKHGKDVGEFAVVSKYPIISADPVRVMVTAVSHDYRAPSLAKETLEVAARYVLDVNGRSVVVYNVHLPSPRDTLRYYMRGAFLYGLAGIPGTPWAAKRQANQEGWNQRIEITEVLINKALAEKLPTILAGDFNMPRVGYCYQQVLKNFSDCHEEAGSGFGFSFPGTTHNPLSLGGPWVRIDYVFFTPKQLDCLQSITEADRASQHRALAAWLTLQ